MQGAWDRAKCLAVRFWLGLREWCGDAAYEKYLHCAAQRDSRKLLTPAQFYVEQLDRKYSRPNRCC